jgi:hypothetical protein
VPEIANNEPLEFYSGDTVQWSRSINDYPADSSWILTYALINSTAKISITATADGADHLVSLSAATTAAYTAGVYQWQAYVTKSSQRFLVDSGTITVVPNFAAATTYDARIHAKKMVDLIEDVLEGRAEGDTQEYTIGNRSMKKIPILELKKLRDVYLAEYNRLINLDKMANGIPLKNRIKVRF